MISLVTQRRPRSFWTLGALGFEVLCLERARVRGFVPWARYGSRFLAPCALGFEVCGLGFEVLGLGRAEVRGLWIRVRDFWRPAGQNAIKLRDFWHPVGQNVIRARDFWHPVTQKAIRVRDL